MSFGASKKASSPAVASPMARSGRFAPQGNGTASVPAGPRQSTAVSTTNPAKGVQKLGR